MSALLPLVNYAHLAAALNGRLEAFAQAGAEASAIRAAADDGPEISVAELVAFISSGMKSLEEAQRGGGAFVSVDDRAGSLLQTFLARRATEEGKVVEGPSGPEVKFDSNDILGWAGSLLDWLKKLKNKHPFKDLQEAPQPISARHRIALLADWGTGLYGAPVCAASIEKDKEPFDMLLHLGDVYYAGDRDEVQKRFLDCWPEVPGALNRALNSNHEMYSGGHGYFELTLPAFKQPASYFALQNDFWLLVGLDSAYSEHDLHGSQTAWLTDLVRVAGERRVVLFSHHQPFSLFEGQGGKLVARLGRLLDSQRIFAWYWGHEHRCAIYDKHPIWNLYGRCIGHGGFPYFRESFNDPKLSEPAWLRREGKNLVPGCQLLDGPNPYIPGDGSRYGPNGYVVLEFDDRTLTEVVHDAGGKELWRKTLV